MRNGLTERQERFCNYYLEEGGNASAAYRRAYGCKGWKEKTIWERASVLMNNNKVATRVEELRAELKAKSDMAKEDVVRFLVDVIQGKEVADTITRTTGGEVDTKTTRSVGVQWAVDRLCKILGFEAPSKSEVTGKDGAPLPGVFTVNVVRTEEDVEEFKRRRIVYGNSTDDNLPHA